MKITGLLISAGFSSRMKEFKPMMLHNNSPFVVTITSKLLHVCEKVVIVTGYKNTEIESTIKYAFVENNLFPRVKLVYNPNFETGMFTSLQTGLKELTNSDWVLYHFVDQPFHKEKFYKEMLEQIDDNYDWLQPVYDGKEGHPVLFSKKIFEKIFSADPGSSLRLIRDDGDTKKKKWECNYPQILKDFDTKEDFDEYKVRE